MSYDSSQTIRYKQGYIHTAYVNGVLQVRVSVKPYATVRRVKSVAAAKNLITRAK